MKTGTKKLISLLISLAVILTALPLAGVTAFAEVSGDFGYKILEDGTAKIRSYNGKAESLEIPSTLDGHTVEIIGDNSFSYCNSLTNVTIPDSVTSIGDSAFSHCNGLTSITIPESVTSIGNSAFEKCHSLTSITIPDSVTSIDLMAFEECDSLTNIIIGNGVTIIGEMAFYCCTGLTSITIPGNVKSIGSAAFGHCSSLKSINISNGVETIGERAFSGTAVESVTIPESVVSLGSMAFGNCDNFKKIEILNEDCELNVIGDDSNFEAHFTIYGYKGSTAETYADGWDLQFIPLNEEQSSTPENPTTPDVSGAKGDVNNDGNLSTVDAKWILQNIAGSRTFSNAQFKAADLNGDGKVTTVDAKWVLQTVAGMRTV